MDFEWFPRFAGLIASGLFVTVQLTLIAGILGFALAVFVALGSLSRNAIISAMFTVYMTVIRGTPLLVQLYILYYGVGSILASSPWIRHSFVWPLLRDGFWYAVAALTISVGAYAGEILREGLRAVPRGELEAARALGMSQWKIVKRIWLPRAVIAQLPVLAGSSVILLKSTALASTITVIDVLGAVNLVRADTYRTYEPLLVAAAIYLVLTFAIEWAFRKFEDRIPAKKAL